MDPGIKSGKKLQDLLLMHIITSTIEMMMSFAESGAIQLQLMDQHPTLLWKEKISKANLVLGVPSIHRSVDILLFKHDFEVANRLVNN